MKKERALQWIQVNKKQENSIKNGHPWIYADEITDQSFETIENGSLVDVKGSKNQYLGTGLLSLESKIRVRLLSRNANETFGPEFFERRVKYALDYRKKVMGADFENCRLVHGEADGLPGVTIDKYGGVLVSEISSYGMEQRKELLYRALMNELEDVQGIYERNEAELRKKEGLSQTKGWVKMDGLSSDLAVVREIEEKGVRYGVDVENGQKTGFFLDQKYNRLTVRAMAKDMKVIDCCTHTGAFAINAAIGGAATVTAVDISSTALDTARANAERNGLKNIEFVESDMFAFLEKQLEEHKAYDFIILDPPAFTKSRRTIHNARNGYERLNTLAMRLLPRGGYLVTNSCSHFMCTEEFKKMITDAAKAAGVQVRIVEERHASPDHPVLCGVEETDYLKFFLLQIV